VVLELYSGHGSHSFLIATMLRNMRVQGSGVNVEYLRLDHSLPEGHVGAELHCDIMLWDKETISLLKSKFPQRKVRT